MQYSRHNIAHNLPNAIKYDKKMAWQMMANEINELAIDEPIKLTGALNQVKVNVGTNPSASKLSTLTYQTLVKNKDFVPIFAKLVAIRHTNDFVNAGGGVYDKANASTLEILNDINTLIEDKTVSDAEKTKIIEKDLKAKYIAKGIKQNVSIGKVIFVGFVITGIIYGACRLLNSKD